MKETNFECFEKLTGVTTPNTIRRLPPDVAVHVMALIAQGKVKVIPDEEIKTIEWRVCAENRIKPENLEEKCSQCGKPVFIDPGYGEGPKLICFACALAMANEEQSLTE